MSNLTIQIRMQVFQSDVSSTQSEGMFAPAAKPRRKNDGAPIPPQQARPLRIAEGALFFWPFLPLKPSAWRRLFPKRKPRTLVRGLLGGWLMGFEPTTPGTTIQCSNQLSYSHHEPSMSRVWLGRERKDIQLISMSSPSLCDFFATFEP